MSQPMSAAMIPRSEPSNDAWSELSNVAAVRELLAQTESAIEDRSSMLAELATQCTTCKSELKEQAVLANQRLDALGGTWDPGRGELPPYIAAAPFTVEGLVGYMTETGATQLRTIASDQLLSSEERLTMAGTISGRIASASTLANSFGIDIEKARATVASEQIAHIDAAESNTKKTAADGGQSGGGQFTTEKLAIEKLECIAQSNLETAQSGADHRDNARAILDDSFAIESRIAALVAAGTPDPRGARCGLSGFSANNLAADLVGIDLELFSSEVPEIRVLAAESLYRDVLLWEQQQPETVPLVSPFIDDGKENR